MLNFKTLLLALVSMSLFADTYVRDDKKNIVRDTLHHRIWQDDVYSSHLDITFDKATRYCKNLTHANLTHWRLPTKAELIQLIKQENYPFTISKAFKNTASEYYWSSSTYESDYAWIVLFRNGSVEYYYKTDTNHVRCVHDVVVN